MSTLLAAGASIATPSLEFYSQLPLWEKRGAIFTLFGEGGSGLEVRRAFRAAHGRCGAGSGTRAMPFPRYSCTLAWEGRVLTTTQWVGLSAQEVGSRVSGGS